MQSDLRAGQALVDFRFGAHCGLKSEIAPCPLSAKSRHDLPRPERHAEVDKRENRSVTHRRQRYLPLVGPRREQTCL
jgi:hypothetical protein